jgi:tetratricopeptide (TPR) repeat protein
MFRTAKELLQSAAQRDPSNHSMPERMAKTSVQLGFELAHTNALAEAQTQLEAGIAAYEGILKGSSRPDTIRDLAQSRIRFGIVLDMRGDFARARSQFDQAYAAVAPLSKSDPQNVTLRGDALSVEFEQARLLVLEGRSREGEDQLHPVIAAFESLDSEEEVGPGAGVLYTWLGEAQMGNREYARALESFRKAVEALEKNVQYADGRCGIVTGYTLAGDALLPLNRTADAETALRTAMSKSDLAPAIAHNDVPALYAIAGAYAAFGHLRMAMAGTSPGREDAARLRNEACGAYQHSDEIQKRIMAPLRLSSSDFPVTDLKATKDLSRNCSAAPN